MAVKKLKIGDDIDKDRLLRVGVFAECCHPQSILIPCLSEQNFAADDFSTEDVTEHKKDEKDWDFVDRASPSSRTVKFNINGRVEP